MLTRRRFACALTNSALSYSQSNDMFADAKAYDRFMGRWSRLLAPLLAEYAKLPEQGRVLDVGSGTGQLGLEIARRNPKLQVTGIDPSKEYVGYARESSRSLGQRIDFQTGDAQNMDFPDATFSAASSMLVFNFIPDEIKAAREVRRVTQPGGFVSAVVWDYGDRMTMLRAFWDAAVEIEPAAETFDEKNMKLCRQGELAKLWRQTGFENVEEKSLEITTNFGSFADYWDPFLLGQGPAGAYVGKRNTAGNLEGLRQALKRRLKISSEQASFSIPARAWAVRGAVPRK